MAEDFYDLLGVAEDAPTDEIKRAFRERVRIYHPDQNDDERARAQFTALKKAYDVLGDPVERRAYDRLGHKTYVAKRTSGIPSPDQWDVPEDDSTERTDEGRANDDASEHAATSSGRHSGRAGGSATSGSTRQSTASSKTTTGARSTRNATSSASTSGSRKRGTTDGGTAGMAGRSTGRRQTSNSASDTGRLSTLTGRITAPFYATIASMQRLPGALVRWKRRRNLAWPLLWMTTLLYLVGIGHFASNNTAALNEISVELSAMTVEFGPIVDYLVADGHDLVTPAAFVVEIEPVTAPISLELWYALLVGIVYLSVVAIVAHRIRFRRNTWGAITLDETIVVATALFVTSILVGGPLLAGSLLLPVIFGVVVHRTRRLPGWSPSYLYVCMVCGPIVGMIAGFVGYHTLLTDLLLFVVLPILGAIGLPLRVLVRRHVGI